MSLNNGSTKSKERTLSEALDNVESTLNGITGLKVELGVLLMSDFQMVKRSALKDSKSASVGG